MEVLLGTMVKNLLRSLIRYLYRILKLRMITLGGVTLGIGLGMSFANSHTL